ncbi:hypothetical protein SASPL_143840 [Salvia splendens]|uniref:Uncharacterized protein n=1 Tax=Salvia splendens TaxID=180675 RepID=A0A8X8WNE4_SALSN|nr:hypothetical protein SASPL_143840 [Salvia splendens]
MKKWVFNLCICIYFSILSINSGKSIPHINESSTSQLQLRVERDTVDDKYQYSCDNKDNHVHRWIGSRPQVGFWVVTPSDEFRPSGTMKADLTSHVGSTSLAVSSALNQLLEKP